jgi:hypothetical protein
MEVRAGKRQRKVDGSQNKEKTLWWDVPEPTRDRGNCSKREYHGPKIK